MYQLKSAIKGVAGRSLYLAGATFMLAGLLASALPTVVHADALNPLTERSLMLSSSSPGFHYLDGSGNSTYAPPNSGPNGQKTGETFSFRVSTDSSASGTNEPLKAFTLQYCTTAAGRCTGPGDDINTATLPAITRTDDAAHSDLNVNFPSPLEVASLPSGPVTATDTHNFAVVVNGALNTGWTMTTSNKEDPAVAGNATTKDNFITLVKSSGAAVQPTTGTQIKLIFYGTNSNYITNPGSGAFFVKINDYKSDGMSDPTEIDPLDLNAQIVDGGVTVANVMTDSIQIQTKVLETMSFSVGTTNPDNVAAPSNNHGTCDPIAINQPIKLGNPDAEYSLETGTAYEGKSYWRLSSNSSGGATVYYSGATLSNTVGDQIQEIGGSATVSHPGTEQFGLGIDSTAETRDSFFDQQVADDVTNSSQNPHLVSHLTPLVASTGYGSANGSINGSFTANFAFKGASLTIPEPVAAETTDVIHCSTAKMRYVANIAADTPAGVYTTAINYLAAPQY
jgi:hypothetical protein